MSLIGKIAKFDQSTKTISAALLVLTVALVCYVFITGPYFSKLRSAKAQCEDTRREYIEQEKLNNNLPKLELRLSELTGQFELLKNKCFARQQAEKFLERISEIAQTHNLQIISRRIAKPRMIVIEENAESKETKEQPGQKVDVNFEIHSAKVVVQGDFYDIVSFMKVLTDRSQKIDITDVRISLPPGEKFNPKAWFNVTVLAEIPAGDEK